jgi:succinate-semialdehyde dehydrogenase/glutarate-semialdehyde dehydrogenase
MEKLCARVCSLKSGRGPDADLGPMTTLRQRDAVRGQVESCLAMGAEIAAQSPPPDELASGGSVSPEAAGLWFPATVLRGVKETMPVMREEIFGPVLAAFPVADDAGALRVANASPYGLTASVWSRNRRAAGELARQINAGVVMINDHLMSHGLAETPWGGFGDSGFGRTHGETGFREMLKATVIVDDILPGVRRNLWWQPYSARVYRGIRAIAELLGGASLAKRLGALPGVLRIFFRYWEK